MVPLSPCALGFCEAACAAGSVGLSGGVRDGVKAIVLASPAHVCWRVGHLELQFTTHNNVAQSGWDGDEVNQS